MSEFMETHASGADATKVKISVAPDTIELSRELILSVFGPSPKRRRLRLSALGNSQAILLLPSWQHPRLKIGF